MSERMDDAAIREAMARAEKAKHVWCEIDGHWTDDEEIGATIDNVPDLAAEALARGEEIAALRAEVAAALASADATIDVTPGEGLASVVRRVCEESDRTQVELDRATLAAVKANERARVAEAEVARLRAAAMPEDPVVVAALALAENQRRTWSHEEWCSCADCRGRHDAFASYVVALCDRDRAAKGGAS